MILKLTNRTNINHIIIEFLYRLLQLKYYIVCTITCDFCSRSDFSSCGRGYLRCVHYTVYTIHIACIFPSFSTFILPILLHNETYSTVLHQSSSLDFLPVLSRKNRKNIHWIHASYLYNIIYTIYIVIRA
jgi:hypothetical protein